MWVLTLLFKSGYRDSILTDVEGSFDFVLEAFNNSDGKATTVSIGAEHAKMIVRIDDLAMVALARMPEDGNNLGADMPETENGG
jgi:hypothetical protein